MGAASYIWTATLPYFHQFCFFYDAIILRVIELLTRGETGGPNVYLKSLIAFMIFMKLTCTSLFTFPESGPMSCVIRLPRNC